MVGPMSPICPSDSKCCTIHQVMGLDCHSIIFMKLKSIPLKGTHPPNHPPKKSPVNFNMNIHTKTYGHITHINIHMYTNLPRSTKCWMRFTADGLTGACVIFFEVGQVTHAKFQVSCHSERKDVKTFCRNKSFHKLAQKVTPNLRRNHIYIYTYKSIFCI